MAKPSKEDFLMQAIDTAVDLAVQSTERIADLLPADLFAPAMAPMMESPARDQNNINAITQWLQDPATDFDTFAGNGGM